MHVNNSVNSEKLSSSEDSWSGSTPFSKEGYIKYGMF